MEYYSENKPIKCPSCGSQNVAPILYGMPSYKARLEERAGRLIIGGCMRPSNGPSWGCRDCKTNIYKKDSASNLNQYFS